MTLVKLPDTLVVNSLPKRLTRAVTKLPESDHQTLLKKRTWLNDHTVIEPRDLARRSVPSPVGPTLVFAQEEAGTAICISPNGVVLTCSHCVAESDDELDWDEVHWLLFSSGDVVAARTVACDFKRDLAILLIIRTSQPSAPFPYVRLSPEAPSVNCRLLCVGHPGSEDLEADVPGLQTNYDSLVLSSGNYRGLDPDQDPQDNSEIGALMHDCWTYWGHSGAPLVLRNTGSLVGVHSSWDDETGMRRGVAWEALVSFLEKIESNARGKVPEGWIWYTR